MGPEAERHSRRGDGWGLVEAEACEGGRDKTQLWEEACDFGRPSDKA